ncbi:MAG: AI-2E family transporter [Proteobacteria bacterium]|nr:AI-2E family transporter [Burkholderiales bacterium]
MNTGGSDAVNDVGDTGADRPQHRDGTAKLDLSAALERVGDARQGDDTGVSPSLASTAGPVREPVTVDVRWGTTGVMINIGASILIVAALYLAKPLLLSVLIALLLTLLCSPLVSALARRGIPESVSAGLVVAVAVAALAWGALYLAGPAQRWLQPTAQDARLLERRLAELKKPLAALTSASRRVAEITADDAPGKPREVVVEREGWGSWIDATQSFAASVVATLVMVYLFLASGDTFLRKLVRVLPKLRDKIRAVEVSRDIRHEIGRYFLVITGINAGLGVATGAAMWWLGMPNPVLWGVMAGVLNFIPYIGGVVSLILIAVAAALSLDSWREIVLVVGVFGTISVIESFVVQPMLVSRRLELNPVIVLLAVAFFGWIWGIGGAIVAVPTLVAVRILSDHLTGWEFIGQFLSRE